MEDTTKDPLYLHPKKKRQKTSYDFLRRLRNKRAPYKTSPCNQPPEIWFHILFMLATSPNYSLAWVDLVHLTGVSRWFYHQLCLPNVTGYIWFAAILNSPTGLRLFSRYSGHTWYDPRAALARTYRKDLLVRAKLNANSVRNLTRWISTLEKSDDSEEFMTAYLGVVPDISYAGYMNRKVVTVSKLHENRIKHDILVPKRRRTTHIDHSVHDFVKRIKREILLS